MSQERRIRQGKWLTGRTSIKKGVRHIVNDQCNDLEIKIIKAKKLLSFDFNIF
jgi:hypothetical protein